MDFVWLERPKKVLSAFLKRPTSGASLCLGGSNKVDEKNNQIAHRRIVAGRGTLKNGRRNNNSPGTRSGALCLASPCVFDYPILVLLHHCVPVQFQSVAA